MKGLNLVRAGFVVLVGIYGVVCAASPSIYRFLDRVDLVFHEAGHVIFGFFGEFIGLLGGSLIQVLVPAVVVAYFFLHQQAYSAAVTLFWVAQSLFNVSVYVKDARARVLPLLGDDISAHDWYNILGRLHLLSWDQVIGNLVYTLGLIALAVSVLGGVVLFASGGVPGGVVPYLHLVPTLRPALIARKSPCLTSSAKHRIPKGETGSRMTRHSPTAVPPTPEESKPTVPLYLLLLGAGLAAIFVWSGVHPRLVGTWWLEVMPVIMGIPILVATYRRLPLTPLSYVLIWIHAIILLIGGYYTYAEMPLFSWIRDAFHLSRNHYDRVGHLARDSSRRSSREKSCCAPHPSGRAGGCSSWSVALHWPLAPSMS